MNVTKILLTNDQFYDTVQSKKQIVLHHTAGGPNPFNVVHGWQFSPERVATSYVISGKEDSTKKYKEGEIIQCFDDSKWAYHLGLKNTANEKLNQESIGIEICNWGQLILKDGKYLNYVNKEVPATEVVKLEPPYRGFVYFHKYSDKQLASLKTLLEFLTQKYNISTIYHDKMFEVNNEALAGASGIWSHTSYRMDKVDVNPQPNLINILKSL